MAVSPTTVVLGVLACIPFGLAARDTLKEKREPPPGESYEPSAEYEADAAAAARASERQHRADVRRDRDEALDQFFEQTLGGDAATLGSRFTIALGDRTSAPPESLFPAQADFEAVHELAIAADSIDGTLNGITLEPRVGSEHARGTCARLATWLGERWGEAAEDSRRSIWLSDTGLQRAVLLQIGDNCKLVVERTTSLEDWIAKTPASVVPVWAIGKSPAQLAAALKLELAPGDTFEWKAPGLGASTGKTELVGYVRRGKIVAIAAHANHSFDSDAIRDHLTATFGKPIAADPDRWKNPPLALVNDRGRVSIVVGTIPQ